MTPGVIAEFDDPEALVAALRAAKDHGWRRMDAYAPYPVPEAAKLLGATGARVAWIAIGAGLFGAALAYATQWWLSVHVYPLNVGGRPLHALPPFLPATTIVGILWAAAGALIGMLALNRLPRLSHPVFAAQNFGRASEDRFFLCLFEGDPGLTLREAEYLLRRQKPLRLSVLAT
ncbi:DUF3341 domain-containing protein [Falsiroseomonas tokyonensis]|uniref:DUF3341 domain-containing protein n=1 Tax=Falsiroseomonas tokyonensis TaxID=430521 RepID=A0ABV7BR88_9PROT|nr:DUF3341 domain-containing protein [Falsiroseomonas tokyonensis]MBU8537177.1 DUF3341 domain-containing protein [Falsiroseomonas tokyonensis]